MTTFLIGALGLLALYARAAPDQTPALSVCDLVARRNAYNGRMVAVRGKLEGVEGAWLVAPSDCEYKLVTKGVIWQNIIYLAYPLNSPAAPDYYHADFTTDWKAIRKAEGESVRAGYDPSVDSKIATYVGLFRTYEDLGSRVNPNLPGALKLGFGPVGLEAPAMLLVQSVGDLVVIHGHQGDQETGKKPGNR